MGHETHRGPVHARATVAKRGKHVVIRHRGWVILRNMVTFRNLKVSTRLTVAFGALLVLMGVATAVAVGAIASVADASRRQGESLALLGAVSTMRAAQADEGVAVRDFVSHADVAAQRAARQ